MYPVDGEITTNATPCPTKCWYPVDGVQHMLAHPADQVRDVITPSTGYSECYTLPDQVLDAPRRRIITTNATPCLTKCWHPVGGVQHMLLYTPCPTMQVLDVITPSTGCSQCYTLPDQVLDVPRRQGNYNKCYTLPKQVLVPCRRGTAHACYCTLCPTSCWM